MSRKRKPAVSRKPKVTVTYQIKPQARGFFKIVEYSQTEDSNNSNYKKRTRYKNLNYSEAEDIVYRLERSKKTI